MISNPSIVVGGKFPNIELPDHRKRTARLTDFTQPSVMDRVMGFTDGYPLIVVFYRGFYCPRDGAQMRQLVRFQEELAVNYCKLVAISVDEPKVCAAYRYGLGASFPFLSDEHRTAIMQVGILDETEGEYPRCAQPYTFSLRPDLTIHRIYDGWYFVGRPTLEQLRTDLREMMAMRRSSKYDAWVDPAITAIRVPAQVWENGAPPLGESGRPVSSGMVRWFSMDDGYGIIVTDDGKEVFFHFTGIPGEGYRTVTAGSEVGFEVVDGPTGLLHAINVQVIKEGERQTLGSLQDKLYSGLNL